MTTKSQEAFEQHYSGYHNTVNEDFSKTDSIEATITQLLKD